MRAHEFITEDRIEPSTEPGTLSLWHGGNLERDISSQKRGRMEYGPGLYLTTHFDTARKYSKGSRKFYLITIRKGNNAEDVSINYNTVMEFIKYHTIRAKQKEIARWLEKYQETGTVPSQIIINLMVNYDALKPSETENFRRFLVENGIDYSIVPNAFGWNETMVVLFNMNLMVKRTIVKPADEIVQYDLPTNWN